MNNNVIRPRSARGEIFSYPTSYGEGTEPTLRVRGTKLTLSFSSGAARSGWVWQCPLIWTTAASAGDAIKRWTGSPWEGSSTTRSDHCRFHRIEGNERERGRESLMYTSCWRATLKLILVLALANNSDSVIKSFTSACIYRKKFIGLLFLNSCLNRCMFNNLVLAIYFNSHWHF